MKALLKDFFRWITGKHLDIQLKLKSTSSLWIKLGCPEEIGTRIVAKLEDRDAVFILEALKTNPAQYWVTCYFKFSHYKRFWEPDYPRYC